MEDVLRKMMMEHYQRAIRCFAHFMAVVVLCFLYRVQQQLDFVTLVQFLVVLMQYLFSWWVARSQLSSNELRLITLLSHVGHAFFVINTHLAEEADYNFLSVFSAAIRVCIAALIHDPPVLIPCQTLVCVVEVACYFGLEGTRAGPPWHFLVSQANGLGFALRGLGLEVC
ncbi:unnamed protein product [Symbiodinium sp. CCMP2456]|nr:unnamed protein product [Symbiodinium sp. CCMP2456]